MTPYSRGYDDGYGGRHDPPPPWSLDRPAYEQGHALGLEHRRDDEQRAREETRGVSSALHLRPKEDPPA